MKYSVADAHPLIGVSSHCSNHIASIAEKNSVGGCTHVNVFQER